MLCRLTVAITDSLTQFAAPGDPFLGIICPSEKSVRDQSSDAALLRKQAPRRSSQISSIIIGLRTIGVNSTGFERPCHGWTSTIRYNPMMASLAAAFYRKHRLSFRDSWHTCYYARLRQIHRAPLFDESCAPHASAASAVRCCRQTKQSCAARPPSSKQALRSV